MVEKAEKAEAGENKKVSGNAGKEKGNATENGNGNGSGKEVKRPIETVNLFTSNGMLSFSVWEGGSISVRVSKRKDGADGYDNVWSGRISPVDFVTQFGDLKAVAKVAQSELKKVLGEEI